LPAFDKTRGESGVEREPGINPDNIRLDDIGALILLLTGVLRWMTGGLNDTSPSIKLSGRAIHGKAAFVCLMGACFIDMNALMSLLPGPIP
jgi:hypothetical protein